MHGLVRRHSLSLLQNSGVTLKFRRKLIQSQSYSVFALLLLFAYYII